MKSKQEVYSELVGKRFKPTFESEIDYFEIRGYDAERDMVLTIAYPKNGEPFDDEIEERYLVGAFETGEYVAIMNKPIIPDGTHLMITPNPYQYLYGYMPKERKQVFNGSCCDRCKHRFGTTSNKEWCRSHYQNEKCYRFKLDM